MSFWLAAYVLYIGANGVPDLFLTTLPIDSC
jgi:hypothetical protein